MSEKIKSQNRAHPSLVRPATLLAILCVLGFAAVLSFSALQDMTLSRIPDGSYTDSYSATMSNIDGSTSSDVLSDSPSGNPAGVVFVVITRLLETAIFLIAALTSTHIAQMEDKHPRTRISIMTMVGVLGMMLIAVELWSTLSDMGIQGMSGHLLVGILKAAVPSLLWLLWANFYAHMDARHVLVYYLTASVVSGVITIVCSLPVIPTLVPLVICAVLAILCVACYIAADRIIETVPFAHGEQPLTNWSFPTVPVVLMAAFTFANVFARDMLPAADRGYATFGMFACLIVLIVMAVMPHGKHLHAWTLCGVAFPLALAGLFGMLFDNPVYGIIAIMCTHAADALFSAFIVTILCNISFRYGVSALLLFGFAQTAGSIAKLAGALIAGALTGSAVAGSTGGAANGDILTLAVALTALGLSICFVILSREQDHEATWGIAQPLGGAENAKMPTQATMTSLNTSSASNSAVPLIVLQMTETGATNPTTADLTQAQKLLTACSQVAYEFGLTRREEEVLSLLTQGKTAAEIESALCVSNSTVKTHTHAVYQKLGIHSRQEVAAFMAQRMSELQ